MKTKWQTSCAVFFIAQLISAFVFAVWMVLSLLFLNKFQASNYFCDCTGWFVSNLVRNQFSHVMAQIFSQVGHYMYVYLDNAV